MKTIVKNYIDLFIKLGYITEKNNLIRLSFDRRKSVELEVIKIKKYKDNLTYKINITDYDKKYEDIDIMSLPVTNPYIDYIDEESCKHRLSKITIHDDGDNIMIKPSLKKIEDECIFNARPHSESICYGSGDVCIYGGALYRQYNGALTHGRFNQATWQQIYPMTWMIMLSCKELPKIYTDSFFYREDIITPELYYMLCNEGNTLISGYKYDKSLDYIKNNHRDICKKYHVIEASNEALLCMILDYITLTPLRSTEIRRSDFGNFYIIENHSILTKK